MFNDVKYRKDIYDQYLGPNCDKILKQRIEHLTSKKFKG